MMSILDAKVMVFGLTGNSSRTLWELLIFRSLPIDRAVRFCYPIDSRQDTSRCSSAVEQRFCKPSAVGSIPTTGSLVSIWAYAHFSSAKRYSTSSITFGLSSRIFGLTIVKPLVLTTRLLSMLKQTLHGWSVSVQRG
jgi:hypothetical protein